MDRFRLTDLEQCDKDDGCSVVLDQCLSVREDTSTAATAWDPRGRNATGAAATETALRVESQSKSRAVGKAAAVLAVKYKREFI